MPDSILLLPHAAEQQVQGSDGVSQSSLQDWLGYCTRDPRLPGHLQSIPQSAVGLSDFSLADILFLAERACIKGHMLLELDSEA